MVIEPVVLVADLSVDSCLCLAWYLSCATAWFGSGHQATFPAIPWESAFVGVSGAHTTVVIPALMVVVATFSPFLLGGLLLPLLLVAPLTSKVFPPLANLLYGKTAPPNRGELFIYEHDETAVLSAFKLGVQYFSFAAIQVKIIYKVF